MRRKICHLHYGGREFAIYDNKGYMLQFGTPTRP
jgi:hypothetical protein